MNLVWAGDADEVAECAAEYVEERLGARPASVLGLPTGRSPLGLYAQLRARSAAGTLDATRVRAYNLDEFAGLPATDPRSYARYLGEQFLEPLNVGRARTRLLDGLAADPDAECAAHEASIAASGGFDLVILGVGSNGHVAFNEPGTAADAAGRCVSLSDSTRAAHLSQATQAPPPARALTVGLRAIRQARALLMIVLGPEKRDALNALLDGGADPAWPVTHLGAHPDLTVIAPVGLRAPR